MAVTVSPQVIGTEGVLARDLPAVCQPDSGAAWTAMAESIDLRLLAGSR